MKLSKLCVLGLGVAVLGGCTNFNSNFGSVVSSIDGIDKQITYKEYKKTDYWDIQVYKKGHHYPCKRYTKLKEMWLYNDLLGVQRSQKTVDDNLREEGSKVGASDVINVHNLSGADGSLETYGLLVWCDVTDSDYQKQEDEYKKEEQQEVKKAKQEKDDNTPWAD